jgi:hypothetical protein
MEGVVLALDWPAVRGEEVPPRMLDMAVEGDGYALATAFVVIDSQRRDRSRDERPGKQARDDCSQVTHDSP